MQSNNLVRREQHQGQPVRNGSRQGANRLTSGNRQPIASQQQHQNIKQMNFGGLPKSSNIAAQRGWQMRKQEPSSQITEHKQIQQKVNNNQLGHGISNSVFDQQDNGNIGKLLDAKKYSDNQLNAADVLVENEMLRSELAKMMDKMKQMEKIIKDKDTVINKQRTDLTNLRKKNFDFRSKITEMEDKAKNDRNANGGREGSRNPRPQRQGGLGAGGPAIHADTANEIALAMRIQREEVREREKQMMRLAMMDSMMGSSGVQAEEDRLLQAAIEASRGDADPNNPNTDNMTYEELLQLEDRNGKVSKGLRPAQIRGIKEQTWFKRGDTCEDSCSICFENFECMQKFKKLPKCPHEFHSNCINKWLECEKRCPICNESVL